ncbi:Quercetin 2,3-dioxygenase [Flavobacterium sp. CECT 9288]|uniref:pirin family protein n=1 Tax=Flavobacterium sp. CECT 9288 TaxID=2845819 RepID=UPI001E38CDCA|nr:pirin family protein [Flavobacterium sp. CECT 9288]CAH0336489.1 Quercetin 2,3-dioxygenase [Flavobacterium sp. CECT 9288]
MTSQLYKANTRGTADFGWLQANFSFSFGNYFNPERVQFGMLRVLNDDTIAAGAGFGTHGHANMEIITIPLEGGLMHKDSMGNEGIIRFGEVQVMSAGSGVEHSEMNASKTERTKTLQLWVFPDTEEVTPRYDQKSFDLEQHKNTFINVVSPKDQNDGNALWVHQKTFFNLGIFDENTAVNHPIQIPNNGVYLFLIEGEIEINNQILTARDAIGITATTAIDIKINSTAKILLIEVPMQQ